MSNEVEYTVPVMEPCVAPAAAPAGNPPAPWNAVPNEIDYAAPATVFGDQVAIATQPAAQVYDIGASVTFTVAATGSPTILYQWEESQDGGSTWNNLTDGGRYVGSLTPSLTISNVSYIMRDWQYRVVLDNGFGPDGCRLPGGSPTSISSITAHLTPTVTGRTWGPAVGSGTAHFIWHGFKPFNWSDNGWIPSYYLIDTGSGFSMRQDFPGSNYTDERMGYIDASTLGGALVYDASTGVLSGGFGATWTYGGNTCNGASFRGSYGGYTGESFVDISSGNFAALLPFYTKIVNGGTTKTYATGDYPDPPGILITTCGNPMWGNPGDEAKEELSEQMTVAQAAANGDAVEIPFTQDTQVDSFAVATGGAVARISIIDIARTIPSTMGWFAVEYTYSQTALAGGEVTTLVENEAYNVGIGSGLYISHQIPAIIGYTVRITDITIRDMGVFMDDAQQLDADSYFGMNPSNYHTLPDWPQAPSFQMDGPSENWDDGEDYTDGLVQLTTGGDGWRQSGNEDIQVGVFAIFDIPGEFWDDAESYPDGELDYESGGDGWLGLGTFSVADYRISMDDGEAYTDGTITTANGYQIDWAGNGAFQVDDYAPCWDDGETYADGALTVTDGGDNWLQNGSFQVNN